MNMCVVVSANRLCTVVYTYRLGTDLSQNVEDNKQIPGVESQDVAAEPRVQLPRHVPRGLIAHENQLEVLSQVSARELCAVGLHDFRSVRRQRNQVTGEGAGRGRPVDNLDDVATHDKRGDGGLL